ncbi:NAD(P)-dependent oxidoreductase [Nakamurella leprariae]|uniref:precorrin-2 dehydrogenase n=1 Tax=Nakamurella leprariae TaxID=2803911 RepID=A0A938YBG6_9ACTN|nr:NAD(P)-dependent oxidoreductase [Nakamurella leprariae]MBM9466744.1 uroporphyrinogen-III C-methyltransferase [Nakamurella leprariae]
MRPAADDPASYPVHLDLTGRAVTVVGGGPVAARKVRGLLAVGAVVTVVAPRVCAELAGTAAAGGLHWRPRRYAAGDLDGAWLAVTATGDPATDGAVECDATTLRTFCVRADRAGAGTAATPATVRRDGLVISVGADGVTGRGERADPGRAVAVRDAVLPIAQRAVALAVDTGRVPLRRRRPGVGRIALVGAGPGGDADLITVRGMRELAAADVVAHDRSVPGELLSRLAPAVQRVDAGPVSARHGTSTLDVEALLEHARAGQRVVCLVAGDPSRGMVAAELAAAGRSAGIAVTVVRGVTTAAAVPITAPAVAHRRTGRRVALLRY